jgi:hypothetical protein
LGVRVGDAFVIVSLPNDCARSKALLIIKLGGLVFEVGDDLSERWMLDLTLGIV